ncbi:MAG TPA: cupredoxin domain-containing protein [Terriglobales bacterium]|nr:cupredoxin domain-containing protein [Terriglobales bacterium]
MKSLLPALLLAIALMSSAVAAAQSGPARESVQTIDVTAKKYEFIPPAIRVKQGTRVQLKITATDHTHGFQISETPKGSEGKAGLIFSSPQECHRIEKGQTATIEFVAQTPGTYPFKCCVHCGLHHRSMKGELVVEP